VVVIVFIWNILSSLSVGYKIVHPYLLFQFMLLAYLLWLILVKFFGFSQIWENTWLAQNFFNDSVIQIKTLKLILYFLLFSHLGALSHKVRYPTTTVNNKIPNVSHEKLILMQKKSRFLFLLFIPYFLCYTLFYVYAVLEYGYFILYDPSNVVQAPIWLSLADDICRTLFWVYIATKPRLKDAKKIIIYYFGMLILSLGMGTRGIIFSEMLVIIASLSYLGYIISVKKIILLGLLLLFLSPVIEYVRMKNFSSDNKYIESVINSQGSALYAVGATVKYEKQIPQPQTKYLFGPIVEFSKSIAGKEENRNNVNELPRLPQVLSLYISPFDFMLGWGFGNSIVSEFYIFGGIFGLCVLSFLFIYFFVSFFDRYRNFTLIFISFISLRICLFSVRENPLYIPVQLCFPFLIYILFLIYVNYLRRLQIKYER
jgi:hypothetical protein